MICLWTDKLPGEHRNAGDEQLLAAFAGGLGLADLAGLFAEMYVRARGDLPDQDPGRDFADREVKLATTIGGAGVLHGDLTAECAAAVAAVLDALSAPAGKEDDRSKGQRYHDALQEAMRSLCFCIMGTWTAHSQTGRKPSSERACAAVWARPTTRRSRCQRSWSAALATPAVAAGRSRPPSRMTGTRRSRKSPVTGSGS